MIRHFGRGAARARALQERREIAAEAVGELHVRILGRCDHCGHAHGFPDERVDCARCGKPRCFDGGPCGCSVTVTVVNTGCEHGREG